MADWAERILSLPTVYSVGSLDRAFSSSSSAIMPEPFLVGAQLNPYHGWEYPTDVRGLRSSISAVSHALSHARITSLTALPTTGKDAHTYMAKKIITILDGEFKTRPLETQMAEATRGGSLPMSLLGPKWEATIRFATEDQPREEDGFRYAGKIIVQEGVYCIYYRRVDIAARVSRGATRIKTRRVLYSAA